MTTTLSRLLTTLERELAPLGVPWGLLALTASDRRQWTLTLRLGLVEATLTASPAELAPRLRSLLRSGQVPCPGCRTRSDLFTRPAPTWTCPCGVTGFLLTPATGEAPWDALLDRLAPLIPETVRDAVLALLEAEGAPEAWFTGVRTLTPLDTLLVTVAPDAAFRALPSLPSPLLLQLASFQLGYLASEGEEGSEETPPTWQREQDGWILRWHFAPSLTLTVFGEPRASGGWLTTSVTLSSWTGPLPSFATLEEAVAWLEARLEEAVTGGDRSPETSPET